MAPNSHRNVRKRVEWARSCVSEEDWERRIKPRFCEETGTHGDIEMLKWLRAEGCPWDAVACANAACGGHLEALKCSKEEKLDPEGGGGMQMGGAVEEALRVAAHEGRQLYIGTRVPELAEPPSPVEFLREWVAPRRPCKVRGALGDWACVRDGRWADAEYLREKLGGRPVTVALTPDGRADAVRSFAGASSGRADACLGPSVPSELGSRAWFVLPDDQKMEISAFLDLLRAGARAEAGLGGGLVAYAQCQNSSLLREYPELVEDAGPDIGFASEAFGRAPDAANLWIGDARSETSFHRDPYENILCVVEGEKTVTLLPPHEGHRCYARQYPVAEYKCDTASGAWGVAPQEPHGAPVVWSPIDPNRPDADAFPRFFGADWPPPLKVTIRSGELLYLPAMWWHYVQQKGGEEGGPCVSVNFWYDMAFDARALTHDLVGAVLQAAEGSSSGRHEAAEGLEHLAAQGKSSSGLDIKDR